MLRTRLLTITLSFLITFWLQPGVAQVAVNRLRSGEEIPKSLFRDFDSRELAEALISRKSALEHNTSIPNQVTFDFAGHSNIVLAFPFKYFSLIRANGFLNQFQVDHSAYMNRKARALVEDQMLGVKIPRDGSKKSAVNFFRPKYAYLALDLDQEDSRYFTLAGQYGMTIDHRYGNVFAKLKDEVKKRSTLTAGDSLLVLGKGLGRAGTFHSVQTQPAGAVHYFEAQVWGEVTLADVDYVLVNCGTQNTGPELLNNEIETMKAAGLKVHRCLPRELVPGRGGDMYFIDKGERL